MVLSSPALAPQRVQRPAGGMNLSAMAQLPARRSGPGLLRSALPGSSFPAPHRRHLHDAPHNGRPGPAPGPHPRSSPIAHFKGATPEGTGPLDPAATTAGTGLPSPGASAPLAPVLLAVGVACMGAFAFGFNLSVINGPLEAIARELGVAGNQAMMGLVVSSTLAGAALGSLGSGAVADSLGRRASFLLAAAPMVAGPLISAYAGNLNAMVAGRFLTGAAIGLSSALVPTYISEVAPTSIRGALGALNQLTICLGILGALLINVALPAAEWRTMFTAAALPAALLGLGMLLGPESPRWLASKHRDAEARSAAERLWGPHGPAELDLGRPAAAAAAAKKSGRAAAAEIEASTPGIAVAQHGGLGLLSGPAARPLLIGVALFAFQQFAGINALVYFSSSVFRQAGVASDTLASAAVGATNVLGTVVAAGLMDRAGRKQLLSNSFLGQAACMFAMAAGFSLPALQPHAGTIAVVGTLGYILSFALGAGPVPGLIVPELNPLSTRGKAVSAAFVSHWVCNVVVGQTFMGAVQSYGLAPVYAFFGTVALLGSLYVRAKVPETKGKTLEQIEAELRAGAKTA
ncbi:hypothetical protein HYH03_003812 [Edaphochlamys debaryana]|uniref:Major facilitator superfamily (MFS) profile domain-containing protein n=1 Tax=Edaphochlamys debaryana TaxID=47281 RepID=A0A835YC06_9CHLO|nr:hypothetical protein HYH03_003812 [Edaphochlamys debaryana]|eukprot:KAG2498051.1 hypothetical protein HYH03_003812 [Edaphochlamys debaryana]